MLKEITGLDLHEMPPFGHHTFNTQDFGEVLISRTGYTGEDGFELLFNAEAGGLLGSSRTRNTALWLRHATLSDLKCNASLWKRHDRGNNTI